MLTYILYLAIFQSTTYGSMVLNIKLFWPSKPFVESHKTSDCSNQDLQETARFTPFICSSSAANLALAKASTFLSRSSSKPGKYHQLKSCWSLPRYSYRGFLKWWYPTTMGFPAKNDHLGVFWGYHHLRKHPYFTSFPWMDMALAVLKLFWPTNNYTPLNPSAAFCRSAWRNAAFFGNQRNGSLISTGKYNRYQCFFPLGPFGP